MLWLFEAVIGRGMLMDSNFNQQIQSALEKINPEIRGRIERQIDSSRDQGLGAFEALLKTAQTQGEDADLRTSVCWILGQLGKKAAAPALIAALGSSDTEVIQEAARSLAMIRSKKALQPLIAVLQRVENPDQRGAAAYGLGLLGDKRAVVALIQTLENPKESPQVRGFCAEALASLGDPAASPRLLAALDDPEVEVRFWSAYALGELKEQRAIPRLERLAETDQAELPGWGTVNVEAAEALASIRASSRLE
jgi:HEAT repeat protein